MKFITMKFITLTTNIDDFFDKSEVEVTVNPSQIVMMKDISDYSDYSTEIELANKSILLVVESIEEILDMIEVDRK